MKSFRDYFKAGAEKAGSQNKLGVALGVSGATIARTIMGMGFPEDDLIVKLADYLEEDPAKILLFRELERCPERSRPYWNEVLKRYASVALIVACTLPSFIGFSAGKTEAGIRAIPHRNIHYQTYFRDTLFRLIRSLLSSVRTPLVAINPGGA